jgi:CheY-like chemotaxis protein
MAGETILVVDDSAVNRKLLAAVLRAGGYQVLLAETAEQALIILATALPDLVLVDVQLPGMSGLDFTRCLREDSRTRSLAVVILTAEVSPQSEQEALDAGANGFLGKPIDTRTLSSRLRLFIDPRA